MLVYSDASSSGLASVYKEKAKANVCCKSFSDKEKPQISPWKELKVVRFSLNSSKSSQVK